MNYLLIATARNGRPVYYTGRAGEGWVSFDRAEAFPYPLREGAELRARRHNAYSGLHGLTFSAVEAEHV